MSSSSLAKIGVISIGDMGMGIAKLLIAHGFSVATNCKGRSTDTIDRAKSAQVELVNSDEELARSCSVILSVVPPRDAVATAQRIVDAFLVTSSSSSSPPRPRDDGGEENSPLYFADLNAVAPSTARGIAASIERSPRAPIRFIDGGIIGGPPTLVKKKQDGVEEEEWTKPSIPTSGPYPFSSIPGFGPVLSKVLNERHVGDQIGSASGLKMCFASLSKGFTALAIQSFTTARAMGVLPELEEQVRTRNPAAWAMASRGVVGMAPKAYRWVREMEEIALTFDEEGGFAPDAFVGAAKVYRAVADDTVLGHEKVGRRKRGLDVEDMAAAMTEGLQGKRKKNE
ncbi:6-phosphogluconate dehydrogenase [Xylariomycetidae sp. FL2044]|nr:6-phosphogluconate dehydrogenase [Xylariomycetidae sp. FL2044]